MTIDGIFITLLWMLFCFLFIFPHHVDASTTATTTTTTPDFSFTVSGAVGKLRSVKPGAPLAINLNPTNIDKTNLISFVFTGDATMWPSDMTLYPTTYRYSAASNGQYALIPGALSTSQIGSHNLTWVSKYGTTISNNNTNNVIYTINLVLEISCSDGIICNGAELYLGDRCVAASRNLCDDGYDCTDDHCNESDGRCSYTINPAYTADQCASCVDTTKCKPSCPQTAQCGSDGCGGTCGVPPNNVCTGGLTCVDYICKSVTIEGTCTNPIDLTNRASALNFNGVFYISDDNTRGVDIIQPYCNIISRATELIYSIHNTYGSFVGLDVVMTGAGGPDSMDTLMLLIEVKDDPNPSVVAQGCLSGNTNPIASVACSDDATPPGGVGSRVTWVMKPGYRYFIVADAYSANVVGPFDLKITLSNTGCTLSCDGKLCGPANCQNFTCGSCEAGKICSTSTNRCVTSPCKPDCGKGRKCGDDGCGGSCGTCPKDYDCITSTGKCKSAIVCDHLQPRCRNGFNGGFGCPRGQYCANDCTCVKKDAPVSDFFVVEELTRPQIVMNDFVFGSCAFSEGCIDKPGLRRLLKFGTHIGNQGSANFVAPSPPSKYPQIYEYGSCHGHYHVINFVTFSLISLNASQPLILKGRKLAYCAEDSLRLLNSPSVPCGPTSTCENQGISKGWIDAYGPDLDCQFLDITEIPSGDYIIEQCVNTGRDFAEIMFENNCVKTPVTIPPITWSL